MLFDSVDATRNMSPTQVMTACKLEENFAHQEGPAIGERDLAGESVRGTLRESMLCPITGEVFIDPVIAPSGHSFERSAIEKWLARRGTDPITRLCNPCLPAGSVVLLTMQFYQRPRKDLALLFVRTCAS